MHNSYIAEWILTLITSRDRAEAVVGDLTEKAAARGLFWFWSGVLRTTASLLWRAVTENNARVARLAFVGLAIYVGIELLHAGFSGALFICVGTTSGLPLHLDSIGWKIWFAAPMPSSSLVIGRMLAHRAAGRELAACLVFAILVSIYMLAPALGNNSGFFALLCILIVLVTVAWGRRPGHLAV